MCIFVSLYALMPVKSESSNAIKDIEANDSSKGKDQTEAKLTNAALPPELEAALTPEFKALIERGKAIKEGRAVPELKFGDAILPAMS